MAVSIPNTGSPRVDGLVRVALLLGILGLELRYSIRDGRLVACQRFAGHVRVRHVFAQHFLREMETVPNGNGLQQIPLYAPPLDGDMRCLLCMLVLILGYYRHVETHLCTTFCHARH